MTDRRAFTLQPLVEAGVFEPGENVLSCSVGGVEYFAGRPVGLPSAPQRGYKRADIGPMSCPASFGVNIRC